MKKILPFLSLVFLQSCLAQEIKTSNNTCEFSFEKLDPCSYQINSSPIIVTITTTSIADDEKLIAQLVTNVNENSQILTVIENTSLFEGDIGYVSFADINFDDVPDLAITTSFGTPNLYLDYWVFDSATRQYVYVGNYSEFTLDKKNQTVTTTVKDAADSYTTTKWYWQGTELNKK
ncbi:hypothetical protein [Cellvibrio sp. pealriver]|uniref:XAC2610-related protein n=1 Tax=Cellvibrio sp. pealriver TaxID=1622269 RepID=UPI00066FE0C9|nr:hypothetical protein [Cellvibrio sp. pealriver]